LTPPHSSTTRPFRPSGVASDQTVYSGTELELFMASCDLFSAAIEELDGLSLSEPRHPSWLRIVVEAGDVLQRVRPTLEQASALIGRTVEAIKVPIVHSRPGSPDGLLN
jgi:hypothetical protein